MPIGVSSRIIARWPYGLKWAAPLSIKLSSRKRKLEQRHNKPPPTRRTNTCLGDTLGTPPAYSPSRTHDRLHSASQREAKDLPCSQSQRDRSFHRDFRPRSAQGPAGRAGL